MLTKNSDGFSFPLTSFEVLAYAQGKEDDVLAYAHNLLDGQLISCLRSAN